MLSDREKEISRRFIEAWHRAEKGEPLRKDDLHEKEAPKLRKLWDEGEASSRPKPLDSQTLRQQAEERFKATRGPLNCNTPESGQHFTVETAKKLS